MNMFNGADTITGDTKRTRFFTGLSHRHISKRTKEPRVYKYKLWAGIERRVYKYKEQRSFKLTSFNFGP